MARHKVAVFGVPTAAGAHGAGVERAPFALRAAGLLAALKEHSTVVNLSPTAPIPITLAPATRKWWPARCARPPTR
jgi:arginase family enzyme